MKLTYNVNDRPKFGQLLLFGLQQLLAILAATIAVPSIIGNGMSQSAALFGAGVGTVVYLLFTKFRSPVFLGSSFAFIGSMFAAFGGAASVQVGYLGLIIGALFAIGVGKMSFGGLGNNPFNPALVGRCFLLVSFPAQMTSWPVAGQMLSYTDATTGATLVASV